MRPEMKPFPFTKAEWAAVGDAALGVVNAGMSDDADIRESHLCGLLDVLAELRAIHGDHPVLLETEADFTEDDGGRVALYQRAVRVAVANGLPTLSIRLSLARVLLDFGQKPAARDELFACAGEMPGCDESDRATWAALLFDSMS